MVAMLNESDSSDRSTIPSSSAADEVDARHDMDEDSASHDRRKYAVDAGGMDAILGSLYESVRSGASFHGDPLSDVRRKQKGTTRGRKGRSKHSGGPRRRQTIESYSCGVEYAAPSAAEKEAALKSCKPLRRSTMTSAYDYDDGPTVENVETSKSSRPLRWSAMTSAYDDGPMPPSKKDNNNNKNNNNNNKPLRRSTMTSAYDYEDGPTPPSKKVSWSNLHSVSLFDLNKSPDAAVSMSKLNVEWSEDAFPAPPLSLEKTAPSRSGLRQEHSRWRPKNKEGPENKLQSAIKGSRKPIKAKQSKTEAARKPIKVISLPWTDHRGVHGYYTGEVNTAIQPHGKGSFHASETDDGQDEPPVIYASATWKDGYLVTAQVPLNDGLNDSKDSSPCRGGASAKIPVDYSLKDASSGPPLRRNSSSGSAETQLPNDPHEDDAAERSAKPSRPGRPSKRLSRGGSNSTLDAAPANEEDNFGNNGWNVGGQQQPRNTPIHDGSAKSRLNATTLPGYQLGHSAKCRTHMIILPSGSDLQIAINNALSLRPLDFAFVLRSDMMWTYSIVADRPLAKDGPAIRFVLDGHGSTKTIRKKYWAKGIRLVNPAAHSILANNMEDYDDDDEDDSDYPISEEESSICRKMMGDQNLSHRGAGKKKTCSHKSRLKETDRENPVSEEESSVVKTMTGRRRAQGDSGSSRSPITKKMSSRRATIEGSRPKNASISMSLTSGFSDAAVIAPSEARVPMSFDHGAEGGASQEEEKRRTRREPARSSPANASMNSGLSNVAVVAPAERFYDMEEECCESVSLEEEEEEEEYCNGVGPEEEGTCFAEGVTLRRTSMNSGFSNAAVVAPARGGGSYDNEDECCDNVSMEEEGTSSAGGETSRKPKRGSIGSGFTNIAVIAPTMAGFDDGSNGERCDGIDPEEEGRRSAATYAPLADDSERTAESLDSKLRAMLSLDYLGTMEDSDEEEHVEEHKCNLYESSHNNEFAKSHSSFHASCHTVNWRDWDGDGTGERHGDSSRSPYALYRKTSSFHHPAAADLIRASRRCSKGSVSFHDGVPEERVGVTGGNCWKRRTSGASGTASLGTPVHEKCSIASCLNYERRRHLD